MDSKKPKPDGPEKKDQKVRPVLTERQRAEARRERQKGRRPARRQPAKGAAKGSDKGNAISRGIRATGAEVKRTAVFLGRSVLSGLDVLRPVGGIVGGALLTVLGFIGTGIGYVVTFLKALATVAGRILMALDRLVTPQRAIAFVGIVAAGLLVGSQVIDYRAIEIGQPGYVAVETITQAPRVEQLTPSDSNSFLLVIAGAVGVVASALSLFSKRRVLGIVMAAVGAVTIFVALVIDLPKAMDTTEATLAYSGVKAILLSGFWLELGAGVVLAVTGLATLLGPRASRARAARTEKRTRRPDRPRRTTLGNPASTSDGQGSRA